MLPLPSDGLRSADCELEQLYKRRVLIDKTIRDLERYTRLVESAPKPVRVEARRIAQPRLLAS